MTFRLVTYHTLAGMTLMALMQVGCNEPTVSQPNSQQNAPAASASPTEPMTTKPASPAIRKAEYQVPAARVSDSQGRIDLGRIPAGSEHELVFNIINQQDQPLRIEKITRDCECISAIDPPGELSPGTTPIRVKFEAPDVAVPYKTRLVLITNSSDRRLISLWVDSQTYK